MTVVQAAIQGLRRPSASRQAPSGGAVKAATKPAVFAKLATCAWPSTGSPTIWVAK